MRTVRSARGFNRTQWLMLAALIGVLAFTAFFAIRAARGFLYWDMKQETPVRGWMSVPYVARMHNIPEPVLYKALDLPPDGRDTRPLIKIAHDQNRPFKEVEEKIANALLEHRAFNPTPEPAAAAQEPEQQVQEANKQ